MLMLHVAGSYGSLPRPVFEKCLELSKRSEGQPDSFHRREYQAQLRDARARVAKLMGCELDECAITNNTTHGVHTILNNFHWKKGDILVDCKLYRHYSTTIDHKVASSQLYVWGGGQYHRIHQRYSTASDTHQHPVDLSNHSC
jgi:selenocysteine lyase/cysteine desulfurase